MSKLPHCLHSVFSGLQQNISQQSLNFLDSLRLLELTCVSTYLHHGSREGHSIISP